MLFVDILLSSKTIELKPHNRPEAPALPSEQTHASAQLKFPLMHPELVDRVIHWPLATTAGRPFSVSIRVRSAVCLGRGAKTPQSTCSIRPNGRQPGNAAPAGTRSGPDCRGARARAIEFCAGNEARTRRVSGDIGARRLIADLHRDRLRDALIQPSSESKIILRFVGRKVDNRAAVRWCVSV